MFYIVGVTFSDKIMPITRSISGPCNQYNYSDRPLVQLAFGTTKSYVRRKPQRLQPLPRAKRNAPKTRPSCISDNILANVDLHGRDQPPPVQVVGGHTIDPGELERYEYVVHGKAKCSLPPIPQHVRFSDKPKIRRNYSCTEDCQSTRSNSKPTFYVNHKTVIAPNLSENTITGVHSGKGKVVLNEGRHGVQNRQQTANKTMPMFSISQKSTIYVPTMAISDGRESDIMLSDGTPQSTDEPCHRYESLVSDGSSIARDLLIRSSLQHGFTPHPTPANSPESSVDNSDDLPSGDQLSFSDETLETTMPQVGSPLRSITASTTMDLSIHCRSVCTANSRLVIYPFVFAILCITWL